MNDMEQFQWKVKNNERDMSLENFIYKNFPDLSHKGAKRFIDNKQVFVNGKNVLVSKWNLKPGDNVVLLQKKITHTPKITAQDHRIEVLFEDNFLIAANKPPFIDHEMFAQSVQQHLMRKTRANALPYLGQMHRLDKETSGIMIFTKKKIANKLAEQFREHRIKKYYLALVYGYVEKQEGVIKKKLKKGYFGDGKKVAVDHVGDEGKDAITKFMVVERYQNASLLSVEILTGRTHQIRVHLSSLGHPIIGDKLYTPQTTIKFRRQALHAEKIIFLHPTQNKRIAVKAALPKDMLQLIQTLRESV